MSKKRKVRAGPKLEQRKDPLARFRKNWPDFPQPWKHANLLVKEDRIGPDITKLPTTELLAELDKLPDDLRAELRQLQIDMGKFEEVQIGG